MASISKEKNRNGWRLSFYGLDKRKRSIWLGGFSKRQANTVKGHVEHLLAARAAGVSGDVQTARWLGSISADLRSKLVKADVIEPTAENRGPLTLGPFLEEYIAGRKDVKPSTRLTYRKAITSLVQYFGPARRIDSITAGDAEMWRVWLATEGNRKETDRRELADNTVRRRTGIARQFFRHAVKRKLIESNPLDGLAAAVHGNEKRQQFVSHAMIDAVLAEVACPQLQAIIALSRYGGLRVPTEVLRLTWQDVDLEAGRLTVRASKTEHHEDGGVRYCPIFPELRPFLKRLYDLANPGIDCPMSSPVITRWRTPEQNLRTPFLKALRRAGVKPWPKLYHNLRASRQTELLSEYPAKDVCTWLGNSQAVAMKHYAMPMSNSFQRAICGATGGSISAAQPASGDNTESETPPETSVSEGSSVPVIAGSMGDEGLEPPTSTL